MPAAFARLVTVKHKAGELNVGPELSPDGSRVMYFSERGLFSIDLYLADAKTGEVIKKITNTATDGHYESIEFLQSAGAWDPTGKRFVFPGISKGEPVLTLIDVDQGRTEREIKLGDVHEVVNPTWSPDGHQIAFSALIGGFNDLFVYDLDKSALRRLTTDSYAEVDPAWSPDGKSLAFSTDRFTTNLETIKAGQLRLAVLDVASGAVREVGGFANAKNIGPQWASDGLTLFFVSDRQGVSNIYRIPVEGGQATQLTNMLTGASGITSLSPAMSAANGRLVFSAYEEDGYNLYALDTAEQLTGTPVIELPRNAAVLPPRREAEGLVVEALKDPTWGLPSNTEIPEAEPYKPKWGLDWAGQPSFGVGVGPFGTYAAGGVAFLFSDMLGNHVIGTAAQVTNRFDEFGGTLFYQNRTHRWNWGVALDQTPYVSRGFNAGFVGNTYVEQEIRFLQRDQSLQGTLSYPFSRNYRVEFGGGYRRIGQKYDVKERTFDANTGQQLDETTTPIETFDTVNLGEASTALVYDTSIFGATSPIRGSRYRLELSQNAGDLTFSGVLADFRTYLMPKRPFTIALRSMYYGRFGRSADSELLPALFLGYPGLVRGYDEGSFESQECGTTADGSCPVFDRLVGSRVAIGNAELRFPIWGAFGGDQFYGPLPIEAAFFADGGVAWGQSLRSGVPRGDNKPVASVGAAIRVNVLGFAVAEIDYVRPLDRPQRGWVWQFSLRPGF
jgi:Tol biopolymer transport system component